MAVETDHMRLNRRVSRLGGIGPHIDSPKMSTVNDLTRMGTKLRSPVGGSKVLLKLSRTNCVS